MGHFYNRLYRRLDYSVYIDASKIQDIQTPVFALYIMVTITEIVILLLSYSLHRRLYQKIYIDASTIEYI
jgi:hypothetical protein